MAFNNSAETLKRVAMSGSGRNESGGFVPGQPAYLSEQEMAALSQSLGREYLAFLQQAHLPDAPLTRQQFTHMLTTQGRLPDNYHIGEGGQVQHDMSKTQAGLLAAGVVGGPALAYGLLPSGAAAGGAGSTTAATGGAGTTATETAAGTGGTLASRQTVPPGGGTLPNVSPSTDFANGTTTATNMGGSGNLFDKLKKYGGIAGDIGSVISNASQANADARRADAASNARAIAENNAAKVQAAQFNLGLPSVRTNQVSRGEVLNTMQDAPMTGDPRIDKFSGGGLRPSAFGPQSRQAGSELSRQALAHLMDPASDRLVPQEIPPVGSSTPEKIASGLGVGLDIFSLLAKYGKNPNQTNPNGLPPIY